jgi:hypothetical protein
VRVAHDITHITHASSDEEGQLLFEDQKRQMEINPSASAWLATFIRGVGFGVARSYPNLKYDLGILAATTMAVLAVSFWMAAAIMVDGRPDSVIFIGNPRVEG